MENETILVNRLLTNALNIEYLVYCYWILVIVISINENFFN